MRKTLCLTLCCLLAGCQTQGYQQYADAMARIAEAQASVRREQVQMMMRLAEFGNDKTVQALAVVMLGMSGNGFGRDYPTVQPPQNEYLQWAQVLLPSVATLTLGLWAYKANKHAVDAQSDSTQAGYNAMFGIAKAGFDAAGSNITTTTNTSTTTTNSNSVGGPGVIGSGSVVLNPLPTPTTFGPN